MTVESMDLIAIREAPSGDFYESLGNLKGVDMTTASMGFKVINTRGFNSTSPVRSLQLIDGVDNQSPGLNFSLGNFLGASDLDVMRVDLIVGASSAYYGPECVQWRDQHDHQGPLTYSRALSATAKGGERNLGEVALRYAEVFKDEGRKGPFRLQAESIRVAGPGLGSRPITTPTEGSFRERDNPGGYDAVNRYGDEQEFKGGTTS